MLHVAVKQLNLKGLVLPCPGVPVRTPGPCPLLVRQVNMALPSVALYTQVRDGKWTFPPIQSIWSIWSGNDRTAMAINIMYWGMASSGIAAHPTPHAGSRYVTGGAASPNIPGGHSDWTTCPCSGNSVGITSDGGTSKDGKIRGGLCDT